MLAESHPDEIREGIRPPRRHQWQQNKQLSAPHTKNTNQRKQQRRQHDRTEIGTSQLGKIHFFVFMEQMQEQRYQDCQRNQLRKHRAVRQRFTQRVNHRQHGAERHNRTFPNQSGCAGQLVAGQPAQRRHTQIQHNRREHIQRKQHERETAYAKSDPCFHLTPPKRRLRRL